MVWFRDYGRSGIYHLQPLLPIRHKFGDAGTHASSPGLDAGRARGIQQLKRVFNVKDFVAALNFTNRAGALAEAEGHHPAILTEGGRVTVTLWTHKIHGLHRNDFVMAAKIEALAPEP